jgi:hypothetical protein
VRGDGRKAGANASQQEALHVPAGGENLSHRVTPKRG